MELKSSLFFVKFKENSFFNVLLSCNIDDSDFNLVLDRLALICIYSSRGCGIILSMEWGCLLNWTRRSLRRSASLLFFRRCLARRKISQISLNILFGFFYLIRDNVLQHITNQIIIRVLNKSSILI